MAYVGIEIRLETEIAKDDGEQDGGVDNPSFVFQWEIADATEDVMRFLSRSGSYQMRQIDQYK